MPKLIILTLLLALSACSTIKSYFPDKHKEYVNSVEIAPLIIPPDLSTPKFAKDNIHSTLPNATQISEQTPKSDPAPALTQEPKATVADTPKIDKTETKSVEKDNQSAPQQAEPSKKQAKKPVPEKVRLVSYAGGATRLQIDEPFVLAWRIVGKALTRKSLEIIDRNINDGLFLIQYDPIATDTEDGSLWDEVTFLFGDDKSNEQEYQIRLIEDKGLTEVLVLDQQGTPLSQGVGLNLLNLMHDTIKASFAEKQE